MVSWMMTIKAVLLSSGVASVALLLTVSVPVALDFSMSRAPILWSFFLSWLEPPYIYVVTNGIIITIVASSKYHRSHHEGEEDEIVYGGGDYKIQTEEPVVNHQAPPRMLEVKDFDSGAHFGFVVANPEVEELELKAVTAVEEEEEELELKAVTAVEEEEEEEEEEITDAVVMAEDETEEEITDAVVMAEDETEEELKSVIMVENSDLVESDFVSPQNSNQNHLPPRMIESEILPSIEKPLVSSRLGHRKLMKASREGGRALRVTKPKRNETLENTWKMITEGKSTPLTKQLYRRSDTFGRGDSGEGEVKPVYKKSETFRDRTNCNQTLPVMQPPPPVKVKKVKVSRSRDELNRRVEAFIKKCNDERFASMRLDKEVAHVLSY